MVGSTNKVDIVTFIFTFAKIDASALFFGIFSISSFSTSTIFILTYVNSIILQASLSVRGRKQRGNWLLKKSGSKSAGECAKSMFSFCFCACVSGFSSRFPRFWLTDYHYTHLISNIFIIFIVCVDMPMSIQRSLR